MVFVPRWVNFIYGYVVLFRSLNGMLVKSLSSQMHLLHDQKRLFFSKSDGSSRGTLQFFRYYFNHPQVANTCHLYFTRLQFTGILQKYWTCFAETTGY